MSDINNIEAGCLKVKDVIKILKSYDPELEMFFRCGHMTGNIKSVDYVQKSTYGSFGEEIPCVIIEAEKPELIDDTGEWTIDAYGNPLNKEMM